LNCVREPDNNYDENAIKIVVLRLCPMKLDVLEFTVRSRPTKKVWDIAGQTVGRMPASFAKIISPIKDRRQIDQILVVYTGRMHHGIHNVLALN